MASISGGTDVVSAFAGGAPTVPVWPGELSAPYLGVALDAYDEVADAFTRSHPNVTVDVDHHDDAEDVVASVEDGQAPDVFLMDHDHVAHLVRERRVQPVNALLEARQVELHQPIEYRRGEELVLTTPGRVVFNEEIVRALERALGEEFDAAGFEFINRALGPYWWAYFIMVSCNLLFPQLFWIKKVRTNPWVIVGICILVNIGMWFERFVIIVTSLHRDFLPSAWGYFTPTIWDIACLLGSFGLFFTMFCLFVRFLPMVATAEVKTVLPQADPHWPAGPEREVHDRRPARTTHGPQPAPEGAS